MGSFLRLSGLVLLCLSVAQSKVYKETVYNVTSLTEETISVDIRSSIPGTLRWTFTDENYFQIFINISANTQDLLDDLSIAFTSNSSFCSLQLDSIETQKAASVTGTGSKSAHVIILIWLSLFVLEWRYTHVLLVLLIANGWVRCLAVDLGTQTEDRNADLEIRAPSRFRYNDSSLFVNGGRVWLTNVSRHHVNLAAGIHCSTGGRIEAGCDSCCHGNGFCENNRCVCDEGFNSSNNCRLKTRDDIYFSHPLDPRLLRSVTPYGNVITLSDISNSEDKIGKVKDPGHVYLEVLSQTHKMTAFFSSDGFLKSLQTQRGSMTYVLQMKRSRDPQCKYTLVASVEDEAKFVFDIDACGENMTIAYRDPHLVVSTREKKNRRTRNRISNKRSRQVTTMSRDTTLVSTKYGEDGEFVDIPVTASRCARDMAIDYNVVFEMALKDITLKKYNHVPDESVQLNTNVGRDGHRKILYLRLPVGKNTRSNSKCEHTIDKKKSVCKEKFLHFYQKICSSLATHNAAKNDSLPLLATICTNFIDSYSYFCDTPLIYGPAIQNKQYTCDSSGLSVEDLFASVQYHIRPRVTFADGKTIIGDWMTVTPDTLHKLRNSGIAITDNKPEVRISKISVIPTDPVPEDIYQVRLDYTCATNQTVIRMNVTGSDLYKNHVTCIGVNECSCCILHAAGASDAVVDHVTINVTDSLSGVHTLKEMVVIF